MEGEGLGQPAPRAISPHESLLPPKQERGQRPPVALSWSKYRGPGTVTFDKPKPALDRLKGGGVNEPFEGKGTTNAKFSEPGEYVLQVTANDYSGDGGGGFQCCWTNSLVRVTVTP